MNDASTGAILVVDDEMIVLKGVRRTLLADGRDDVLICSDPRSVEEMVDAEPPALILLDLNMPHISGQELLERLTTSHPEIPIIIVTAEHDVRIAVDCMKQGAYDYLTKPALPEEITATVRRALEHKELVDENQRLRSKLLDEELANPDAFESIITVDPAMRRVFAYIEVVAKGSHPVLVTGETGTGKELVARAIHNLSGRKGPFTAVNVAGLDDTMFSDTLFGHKPGAFTGAAGVRRGMIEAAGKGTLFLDEIGDLAESSQVKLLRVLQEREYLTLGDDTPRKLDARVVTATHHDPDSLRRDLYFRLRAYHVRIPPLRERLGDLPALVNHFVRHAANDLEKDAPTIPDSLYVQLGRHEFPGNVRELQAMVFDAMARHTEGPLPMEPFAETMGGASNDNGDAPALADLARGAVVPDPQWRELERQNIVNALERANWKISGQGGAAQLLQLKASTLESRMKSYAIEKPN